MNKENEVNKEMLQLQQQLLPSMRSSNNNIGGEDAEHV